MKILILGDYGSGKTMGLRNIPPEQLLIFNFDNKHLTWKEGLQTLKEKYRSDGSPSTTTNLFVPSMLAEDGLLEAKEFLQEVRAKNPEKKYFVIDTLYYALQDLFNDTDQHDTFKKFDLLGQAAQDFITSWANIIGPDRFLIMHNHITVERVDGLEVHNFSVPKGKVIRDQVKPEGRVDVSVESFQDVDGYFFRVKSRGAQQDTIRTFHGMYEEGEDIVENDTKDVCDRLELALKGEIFNPPKAKKRPSKKSPSADRPETSKKQETEKE